MIGTLEVLRGEATGAKALLQRWHPGVLDEIDRDLKHLAAMIEAGDFIEARKRLTRLRSTLQERQGTAMKLEEQDQQRWYVAEALRTVCSEMGWGEEQTPRLEDDQKPGSDILYEVDTYSAGTMAFRLSLEGLTADSPLSRQDRACYKDFGTVAEKLKILGVIAKLEAGESADDLPELRQRGEMDIPDEGVSQGMEA